MSSESLKAILGSPLGLFALMLFASFANGMKQISVTRQTSVAIPWTEYWSHIPETMVAILGNVAAFVGLVLTDQLNFASALGIGYGINSLADFLPKGRSYALKASTDIKDPP